MSEILVIKIGINGIQVIHAIRSIIPNIFRRIKTRRQSTALTTKKSGEDVEEERNAISGGAGREIITLRPHVTGLASTSLETKDRQAPCINAK